MVDTASFHIDSVCRNSAHLARWLHVRPVPEPVLSLLYLHERSAAREILLPAGNVVSPALPRREAKHGHHSRGLPVIYVERFDICTAIPYWWLCFSTLQCLYIVQTVDARTLQGVAGLRAELRLLHPFPG